ncbi:MAG: prepilin-type N-terminal cleavage/methylation domain-containing protein [Hyphomicrobiales bacterium]|nr:prepilin-type N-terminal cleavage/methylation domain-containing protein [Hyphomicrobiales bacterium]
MTSRSLPNIRFEDESGVTLVEVLISLALLSVLSSLILVGFRQVSSVNRTSEYAQSKAETNIVLDHMAEVIRSAIQFKITDKNNRTVPAVSGSSSQLQIFTLSDGTVMNGGIYQVGWSQNEIDGEHSSLLENWLEIASHNPGSSVGVISRPVISNLEQLEFRYLTYGQNQSDMVWLDYWASDNRFPLAVEINLSQSFRGEKQKFSRIVQMPKNW